MMMMIVSTLDDILLFFLLVIMINTGGCLASSLTEDNNWDNTNTINSFVRIDHKLNATLLALNQKLSDSCRQLFQSDLYAKRYIDRSTNESVRRELMANLQQVYDYYLDYLIRNSTTDQENVLSNRAVHICSLMIDYQERVFEPLHRPLLEPECSREDRALMVEGEFLAAIDNQPVKGQLDIAAYRDHCLERFYAILEAAGLRAKPRNWANILLAVAGLLVVGVILVGVVVLQFFHSSGSGHNNNLLGKMISNTGQTTGGGVGVGKAVQSPRSSSPNWKSSTATSTTSGTNPKSGSTSALKNYY